MRYDIDRGNDALVIVDVQRDFCSTGALPVAGGDEIVPALNKYARKFSRAKAFVVATKDWHPRNHVSFIEYGGMWPSHCVKRTTGARFHPGLKIPRGTTIIPKGTSPSEEAYSAFDGTDLEQELKARCIGRLFVGGLATDYCVKRTVLDALGLGFNVVLLEDAIRGVDINPKDSEKAVEEMLTKGAKKSTLSDLH